MNNQEYHQLASRWSCVAQEKKIEPVLYWQSMIQFQNAMLDKDEKALLSQMVKAFNAFIVDK